jgi:hypothetical protein
MEANYTAELSGRNAARGKQERESIGQDRAGQGRAGQELTLESKT